MESDWVYMHDIIMKTSLENFTKDFLEGINTHRDILIICDRDGIESLVEEMGLEDVLNSVEEGDIICNKEALIYLDNIINNA